MIDLHIHSSASDGTDPPERIAAQAAKIGLTAIALTDHDTLAGLAAAQAAGAALGLRVISGLEVSTEFEGREVHLLGYGFDPDAPSLAPLLAFSALERTRRNEAIVGKLNAGGYPVSLDEIVRQNPGTVIGRPHIAEALVRQGGAKSIGDAFARFLGEGKPYYLPRSYVSPADAVLSVQRAGGVAVLAHPLQYSFSDAALERFVRTAAGVGAAGLEVYYTGYSGDQIRRLVALANLYGLLQTGGSDYHGSRKAGFALGFGDGSLLVPDRLLSPLDRALEASRRRAAL